MSSPAQQRCGSFFLNQHMELSLPRLIYYLKKKNLHKHDHGLKQDLADYFPLDIFCVESFNHKADICRFETSSGESVNQILL